MKKKFFLLLWSSHLPALQDHITFCTLTLQYFMWAENAAEACWYMDCTPSKSFSWLQPMNFPFSRGSSLLQLHTFIHTTGQVNLKLTAKFVWKQLFCMSYYLEDVGWFCVVLFEGKTPLKECLKIGHHFPFNFSKIGHCLIWGILFTFTLHLPIMSPKRCTPWYLSLTQCHFIVRECQWVLYTCGFHSS